MTSTNNNKSATEKLRQSTLNVFLNMSSSEESDDPVAQVAKAEEQKRREISNWTGVKARDQFLAKEPTVTNIGADLRALLSETITVPEAVPTEQMVLFDPDVYKGNADELMSEDNTMTQEQLIEYGKMVTEVRADINRRAEIMEADEQQRAKADVDAVNADTI